MALLVWLPLNGNLNNQGLSNITISGTPAYDNNGKIGKCVKFNKTLTNCLTSNPNEDLKLVDELSYCLWIKNQRLSEDTGSQWVFTVGRCDMSTYGYGVQLNSAGSSSINLKFGSVGYSVPTTSETWTHICLTKKGNQICTYKDGLLYSTNTFNGTLPQFTQYVGLGIGFFYYNQGSIYPSRCSINDLRIYDHCLSPKEIKEISKGLVLHYPLSTPEILLSKCKNITWNQLCNTTFTSYVPVSNSDGSFTLSKDSGTYYTINTGVRTYMQSNSTHKYYISGRFKSSVAGKIYLGMIYYNGSKTSNSITCYLTNKYQKVSFINATDVNASSQAFGIGTDSANDIPTTFTFRDIQCIDLTLMFGANNEPTLDEFEMMFPFNYYPQDSGTVKDLSTPIYDRSGYRNNGTTEGTLTLSDNTPRYNYSTKFNGSSSIKTLSGKLIWSNYEYLTIAAWMKPTVKPSGYTGSIGIGHDVYTARKSFVISNFSGEFTLNMTNGDYVNIKSGYVCPLNEWHHYTATLNGTELKMYVDGNLIKTQTIDWKNATNCPDPQFQVGVDLPGTDEHYTGYYSDVRIYSTTLSDQDILELYNTSALVDNKQNIMSYEFIEDDSTGRELSIVPILSDPEKASTQNGDLVIKTHTWISSDYIEIDPTNKTYYYDIEYSTVSGNWFLVGFERYDSDKQSAANNGCIYIVAGRDTQDHKRLTGTIDLSRISSDGNTTAYIKLRILNDWDTTGNSSYIGKIHHLSLKEVTTIKSADINKNGATNASTFIESSGASLTKTGNVLAKDMIEL